MFSWLEVVGGGKDGDGFSWSGWRVRGREGVLFVEFLVVVAAGSWWWWVVVAWVEAAAGFWWWWVVVAWVEAAAGFWWWIDWSWCMGGL